MVHHVPVVTPDLLTRLKALGCGVQMARVPLGHLERSEGGRRPAVPDDRRSRHPGRASTATASTSRRSTRGRTSTSRRPASTRSAPGSTATSSSRAQEALRLFTRGNSWFLRMEDKIGSIEPGKLADLRRARPGLLHACPTSEIKQIRSVLTIVDGRVVHGTLG